MLSNDFDYPVHVNTNIARDTWKCLSQFNVLFNVLSVLNTTTLNFLFCRFIVLTTSVDIIDHEEAKRKHTGGKVLGFFY